MLRSRDLVDRGTWHMGPQPGDRVTVMRRTGGATYAEERGNGEVHDVEGGVSTDAQQIRHQRRPVGPPGCLAGI